MQTGRRNVISRRVAGGEHTWNPPQLEILDAAAIAFMESGYSATSMNDIADILEATKGRVYHYYRSKAVIFMDVLLRAVSLLYARVEPIARGDDAPAVKLKGMATEHCLITMEKYPYFRVTAGGILDISVVGDELKAKRGRLADYMAYRDEYENLFSGVIEQGVADGSFRKVPPRIGSKEVLGSLNWMTVWYRPQRSGEAAREVVEEMATFIVNGLVNIHRNRATPRGGSKRTR